VKAEIVIANRQQATIPVKWSYIDLYFGTPVKAKPDFSVGNLTFRLCQKDRLFPGIGSNLFINSTQVFDFLGSNFTLFSEVDAPSGSNSTHCLSLTRSNIPMLLAGSILVNDC